MVISGDQSDLYESAAIATGARDAQLHLERGVLYVGKLGGVGPHVHSTAVFLGGLYGAFRLRVGQGEWLSCQAAVIPAGILHELDGQEMPLAALYPEPERADHRQLLGLLANGENVAGCGVGRLGDVRFFRELYESRQSHQWLGEALSSLLDRPSLGQAGRPLDARLLAVLRLLQGDPGGALPIGQVAAMQGLSASRLMHLFTEQLGVPYRRYRVWCRLQLAMRAVGGGASLTDAAQVAGFSDSQHFSHDFRRSFGIRASDVLRRVGRIGSAVV